MFSSALVLSRSLAQAKARGTKNNRGFNFDWIWWGPCFGGICVCIRTGEKTLRADLLFFWGSSRSVEGNGKRKKRKYLEFLSSQRCELVVAGMEEIEDDIAENTQLVAGT